MSNNPINPETPLTEAQVRILLENQSLLEKLEPHVGTNLQFALTQLEVLVGTTFDSYEWKLPGVKEPVKGPVTELPPPTFGYATTVLGALYSGLHNTSERVAVKELMVKLNMPLPLLPDHEHGGHGGGAHLDRSGFEFP